MDNYTFVELLRKLKLTRKKTQMYKNFAKLIKKKKPAILVISNTGKNFSVIVVTLRLIVTFSEIKYVRLV